MALLVRLLVYIELYRVTRNFNRGLRERGRLKLLMIGVSFHGNFKVKLLNCSTLFSWLQTHVYFYLNQLDT